MQKSSNRPRTPTTQAALRAAFGPGFQGAGSSEAVLRLVAGTKKR